MNHSLVALKPMRALYGCRERDSGLCVAPLTSELSNHPKR
jgi:hypothetical protein